MSGGIAIGFVDFADFLFESDRVRCAPAGSFLVRNWCDNACSCRRARPDIRKVSREHPEAPRITAATINKQLGSVQAICVWASDNGLIPDDVQWTDPFSRLRLPTERSERTSFEIAELQSLFNAPRFTEHRFPLGAHGAAGFWLPVLALYTGARQAELGRLNADNVLIPLDVAHHSGMISPTVPI
ncbi:MULTISPECIES: hypothetical protein [unclassified Bradyrhizobium]|uniref:hypothetical protein n=1 Tax=unclassified Bradyrhizobium TaxID=2631580 RepID=UPI00247A299E|nr:MULTISPECIES: hypothetical protein [unclassified Bradyrhizobium]WGR70340.1 hypothetical protein MTX24_33985 [Bradyrhizobium sp. ISRA426]WGR82399.1 hypothetical protein MTX21_19090 [Bradyrhizobium sp. ISRA430]WGR85585.1 hypothetical protein MTX25_33670 [Bradyrhizobium sp. ISRA432]